MAITAADINLHLTGGSSNSNVNASLGGNVSTVKVTVSGLHNLFRRITESELSSGVTIYRCIALKNDHSTESAKNPFFYLVSDTTSIDDLTLYSISQAAKNSAETAIANEFTAPTGSNINFIQGMTRTTGLDLPDLGPGEYINIWIKVAVEPGAAPLSANKMKYRIEINPSSTIPSPTPDPTSGIQWSFCILGDCSCGSNFGNNWTKIKNRDPTFVWFNGDDAYSSGSKCFTDKIGSTWQKKSSTSFGNHDVDESESQPETKNQLLNFFGLSKTYYSRTIKNAGFIVMEAGENESVGHGTSSAQYAFVRDELKAFRQNSGIEWIFVLNHYPLYGPNSNHNNESDVRDKYDPLFDTNGVDVVFTSHNHNLWSSKLLKYNSGSPGSPTSSGTDPNYSYRKSDTNHGKLYIGSGAGGKSHYSASAASYTPFLNDNDYGYWLVNISDTGKKLTLKAYSSSDSLLKTVTLTHTT